MRTTTLLAGVAIFAGLLVFLIDRDQKAPSIEEVEEARENVAREVGRATSTKDVDGAAGTRLSLIHI